MACIVLGLPPLFVAAAALWVRGRMRCCCRPRAWGRSGQQRPARVALRGLHAHVELIVSVVQEFLRAVRARASTRRTLPRGALAARVSAARCPAAVWGGCCWPLLPQRAPLPFCECGVEVRFSCPFRFAARPPRLCRVYAARRRAFQHAAVSRGVHFPWCGGVARCGSYRRSGRRCGLSRPVRCGTAAQPVAPALRGVGGWRALFCDFRCRVVPVLARGAAGAASAPREQCLGGGYDAISQTQEEVSEEVMAAMALPGSAVAQRAGGAPINSAMPEGFAAVAARPLAVRDAG